MFEKAARLKLRINYKGLCSVEDLWDLSVNELDMIFKKLNARLREQKEDSLLEEKSPANNLLMLEIDIVKHIVSVKLAEKAAAEMASLKADRKQKILGIIAHKQDAALMDMPVEELNKLLEEL